MMDAVTFDDVLEPPLPTCEGCGDLLVGPGPWCRTCQAALDRDREDLDEPDDEDDAA